MLHAAFLAFIVVATVWSFANWRHGLLLTYLVGLLQDPARKAIEGRPAYLVLAVVPVMAATIVGTLASQRRPWRVFVDYPSLAQVLLPLAFVVLIGALVTLASFGGTAAIFIPFGLVNYLGPFVVIAMGYHVLRDADDLRRMLLAAAVLSSLSLIGVAFEYKDYDWSVLGTVHGQEWYHHFGYGKYVSMICGFHRSPEIMGWHAALVAMIAIILLVTTRGVFSSACWVALGSWGLTCALLSGRRKMILMVVAFALIVILLSVLARRGGRGMVLAVGLVALIIGTSALTVWLNVSDGYVELAATALPDTPKRAEITDPVTLGHTLRQAGMLGYGLGTLSQGVQHLHVKGPANAWQEGGTNKVLGELGLPGAFTVGLTALVVASCCVTALRRAYRDPRFAPLALGLFAMLLVNALCFVAAQQIYGDPFILYLHGLMLGMLLSAHRLVPARSAAGSRGQAVARRGAAEGQARPGPGLVAARS